VTTRPTYERGTTIEFHDGLIDRCDGDILDGNDPVNAVAVSQAIRHVGIRQCRRPGIAWSRGPDAGRGVLDGEDRERCASSSWRRHRNVCAAQQACQLGRVGHRLVPVAVVYARLNAALTRENAGQC
jgi:hypothetical protein